MTKRASDDERKATAAKRAKATVKSKARKLAAEGAMKAREVAVHQTLAPLAHEINVRMEKVTKSLDQADDHRLAAALRLVEAKQICAEGGVKFVRWCDLNVIDQSERTIRQLVAVGSANEPAKALADLREDNKKANKKHRAVKKKVEAVVKEKVEAVAKLSTLDRVSDILGALQDDEAANTLGALAERSGMRVVTAEVATRGRTKAPSSNFKDIMALFSKAPGSVQMDVVVAVCEATGTEITNEFAEPEADPLAIPPHLQRSVA